ncbi:hypothetical protein THRCLA_23364 [Thraustotheca clavata]|uniref:Uncharacterized protein n=1 Tax=Thraustotheca clavata TaxID=74557 RepID=A0A1V9Y6Y1_9STRA|nr:hypothetical protein THRCLA_23364 [Thraustotheca clavata]
MSTTPRLREIRFHKVADPKKIEDKNNSRARSSNNGSPKPRPTTPTKSMKELREEVKDLKKALKVAQELYEDCQLQLIQSENQGNIFFEALEDEMSENASFESDIQLCKGEIQLLHQEISHQIQDNQYLRSVNHDLHALIHDQQFQLKAHLEYEEYSERRNNEKTQAFTQGLLEKNHQIDVLQMANEKLQVIVSQLQTKEETPPLAIEHNNEEINSLKEKLQDQEKYISYLSLNHDELILYSASVVNELKEALKTTKRHHVIDKNAHVAQMNVLQLTNEALVNEVKTLTDQVASQSKLIDNYEADFALLTSLYHSMVVQVQSFTQKCQEEDQSEILANLRLENDALKDLLYKKKGQF